MRHNQFNYSYTPFHRNWRPAIAWSYLVVCLFDFIIYPVFFSLLFKDKIDIISTWVPFTLRSGGLYHMAMLTIVGVSAWNRTQEKLQAFTAMTHSGPATNPQRDYPLPPRDLPPREQPPSQQG
jgi:hypothetical protein